MAQFTPGIIVGIAFIFGIVFTLLLIAHEDGKPFAIYRRIRCKYGKHIFKTGYRKNINKYFCQNCKAPRKHPELKILDGGKRDLSIKFRF